MGAGICSAEHRGNYRVIREKSLVVEYHEGIGALSDAKKFKREQAMDLAFSPNFNIIVDLRNLTFNIAMSDVRCYIDFLILNSQSVGVRRNAILTQTPLQAAIATLFKDNNQLLPQSVRVVSTISAALSWVDTDLTLHEFNAIIKELKHELKGGADSVN